MKIVFLFRPNFCGWPLAATSLLEKRLGSLEVSGIVRGKERYYRRVQSHEPVPVQPLYWLAELENRWLESPVDDQRIAEVRERFGDEMLNRTLMTSRHLGAGWIRSADLPGTRLVRNSGNSQYVNRYVPNLIHFVSNYLEEFEPDLVFVDDVGNMAAYVLSKVAHGMDVPFRKLAPARHEDRYVLDHAVEDRLQPVAQSYRRALRGDEDLRSWKESARSHLRSFRDHPEIPDYSKNFRGWAKRERSTSQLIREVLKSMYALPKSLVRGQPVEPNEPTAWDRRKNKLKRFLRKFKLKWSNPFPEAGTLPDRPFVYFPLQVSPEISTLIYSPHHTNPLPIVELLARQVPFGWEVLVKETPRMIGRRPTDFYDRLRRMPKVSLTSPFTNTFHCLRESEFVFTVTGTPGWEAMKLRKPALIAGDVYPFLVLEEGFVHAPEYLSWGEAVKQTRDLDPVPDEKLVLYIAALLKHSFRTTLPFARDEITRDPQDPYRDELEVFCDRLLGSLPDR